MSVTPEVRVFLGMSAIVASPVMQQLLNLVQRVAQTPASVLIQGESGSGKELIARAVHHYSLRCSKPWVDVSCGALPEHLMESELFGYEKGAFSSADSPKPGLFELANHGTLFLDEVGELEPRMQVKLLRVLDGIPYYRLGGVRKVSVDVRIIAATNQNLEQMMSTSRFRSDLYHRLGQINLRVPPLRERHEDILPLAQYFLEKMKPGASFGANAQAMLERHDWPGNIRELRNVVSKSAMLCDRQEIAGEELALEIQRSPVLAAPASAGTLALEFNDSLNNDAPNLDGIERRTILKVLGQTNGHQQRAAELLGISRRTLSRKLKTYGTETTRRVCAS